MGMIYLGQASLTVNHATIDGNKTEYPNGHPLIVIYNNPTLTINDGAKLCNNNTTSTTARYGGIYVRGSNAVISGGKIYGNTSTYGGGINVSGQGDLTITGTALIEKNSAEYGTGKEM